MVCQLNFMNASNMEQPDWQAIAAQLRKPQGEMAHDIGIRMNQSNALINKFTLESLDLRAGMEILEIGMGNGHFIPDIFDIADVRYTGMDYSKEMTLKAQEFNQALLAQNKVRFINCAIEDFPASESLFDRIFTVNTLYFWDHPEKTLKVIRSLLHPNGQLCIAIRPKHVMEQHPFTNHGFKLFTRNDVCQLLEANAFNTLAVIERKEDIVDSLGMPMQFETLIVKAVKRF